MAFIGDHCPPTVARKAVVLLSGGLDSTTVAAMARESELELYALSFDYGQRHKRELEAARAVAKAVGVVRHEIMTLPLGQLGGSALTTDAEVPDAPAPGDIGQEIPVTYVPARNTVFIACALAYAEVVGADEIHLGINAMDYSGYPDCRPEYVAAYQEVAKLATKQGVEGRAPTLMTPLIHMTKAEIVTAGMAAKAPLELTWSCYRGGAKACGTCESCVLRLQGFASAGTRDPIVYEVR